MNKEYNFNEVIERSHTESYKYDYRQKLFGKPDVIPMWVADMDIKCPDFVVDAIKKRLSHEIFGYTFHSDALYEAIINWINRYHQWKVERDWIGFTPGVVPAFNMALLTFTKPGDKVIIQSPVYHPFYYAMRDHKRTLVTNPLVLKNGRYEMDFDHLISSIDDQTKMIIFCSPHNPTGNVWKRNELQRLGEICTRKGILILSDEIHADIVYSGHKHIPLASVSAEIANNTITLMAASKTFNFAGLSTSYFIASNKKLFHTLQKTVEHLHINDGNIFGNIATEAAYRKGDEWLKQLITHLEKNIATTREFINKNISGIKLIEPEATFLLWLDCRELGLPHKELCNIMIEKAGLGLSEGTIFGIEGSGFQRINIGCPTPTLIQALENMKDALSQFN